MCLNNGYNIGVYSISKGIFLSLIRRFKVSDIPGAVSKGAPDFCTVYIIGKGKIQSMRSASRPAPAIFPLQVNQTTIKPDQSDTNVVLEQSVKG
jgi:hypothetical protein